MEISFIGAGNVAWHLGPAFENAGHHINEVYSRQLTHARQLVSMLYDARPVSDLNLADSPSALFVVSVPDAALEDVCARLVLPEGAAVVHTSGSLSLETLAHYLAMYSDVPLHSGVFYPLQSFTRGRALMPFDDVPLCLEAADATLEDELVTLGQGMSDTVYLVSSNERLTLHVAAVFANNFTNHCLTLARDLVHDSGLEFDLLKPLIEETFVKALSVENPHDGQTGPARRGDANTLALHRQVLANVPALSRVYDVMTESIRGR